jgi:hypothetical protein
MKQLFGHWQAVLPALVLFTACEQDRLPETTVVAPPPAGITRTASVEGARVFFITPSDGDTVSSPVRLEFGLSGMELAPSGDPRPNSGHHHIVIDHDLPDLSLPVPADAEHVHFGDGRSATELELAPGRHTLQLLLGDHLHIPHDPPLFSEQISITVE